jgi:hypothetical protein
MLKSFIKWPQLVLSAVYEKIAEQAKKANTSVKNFLGDDTNIDHISLVVYDVLPLAIKLGLRFDKFNKSFHEHFKTFRDKIYSYEESLKKENSEVKDMEESQSAFKSRLEDFGNAVEAFNSKNYPNGVSPKEVHAKINEMMEQAKKETSSNGTTMAKMLKDFQEKSANNTKDLANTSDMSKEEIREKFINMVSEGRENKPKANTKKSSKSTK